MVAARLCSKRHLVGFQLCQQVLPSSLWRALSSSQRVVPASPSYDCITREAHTATFQIQGAAWTTYLESLTRHSKSPCKDLDVVSIDNIFHGKVRARGFSGRLGRDDVKDFASLQQSTSGRYKDRFGYEHFHRPRHWSADPTYQIVALASAVGLGWWVYTSSVQTVPYTHRRHLILISPQLERQLGDATFQEVKTKFAPHILPPNHPLTVSVRQIATKIVRSAMEGTRARNWGHVEDVQDSVFAGMLPGVSSDKALVPRAREVKAEWAGEEEDKASSSGSDSDMQSEERLEEWLDNSRRRGLAAGTVGYTKHLEGLEWELLVIDNKAVNAFVMPSGKIVVFTGLIYNFPHEAEVAAILGHEVAHVVARHTSEHISNGAWILVLQLILAQLFAFPGFISDMATILLRLPFSRRAESEADRIGLLLMANAGYDPRVAVEVEQRLGSLNPNEPPEYLSTHPSGKNRARALANSSTMVDAMKMYEEKLAGQASEGFL